LRDHAAAARVHASLLSREDLDVATRISVCFAKGALEAELGQWEASAADYARALELDPPEPSRRVEALVRRGFALFQLDRLDEARAVLADADRVWSDSQRDGSERFPSLYFVAMGRFYQAAVLHRRFLDAPIRLPMAQMKADFDRKLELLDAAQRAYNETIAVKHPYWVSAAGYQLGELFERFYVDVSRSPVPVELDAAALRTYERELDAQLRPAIEKAMWVHEQNLAAARRLGYATAFVERSERALARLRSVGLEHGDFRALLVDAAEDEDAGVHEGGTRARGDAVSDSSGSQKGGSDGGDPSAASRRRALEAAEPPFVPPMRPL
jgi:tetratricopeptide (TPR) repeat protein